MNYTSIKQSKKLLELGLNSESADMVYPMLYHRGIDGGGKSLSDIPNVKIVISTEDIPCWSLAALLSLIPEVSLNAFKYGNWNVMIQSEGKMIYVDKDNPIDACYEMIIKLHELNLL